MRTHGAVIITALLSAIMAACSACGGTTGNNVSNRPSDPANQNKDVTNIARTNVEELGLLTNMPYEAQDVVWREDASQKKLVAVLRFSTADADKLVQEAGKAGKPTASSVSAETWFPAELIAQSDLSGDDTLKGTSYPANAFYQPPYSDGKITRIENTDYFVLELSAK